MSRWLADALPLSSWPGAWEIGTPGAMNGTNIWPANSWRVR